MRYVMIVVTLFAIIGGTFFNQFVMKRIDLGTFSNQNDYMTNSEAYVQFMDAQFRKNSNSLPDVLQFFNEKLKLMMQARTTENGSTVTFSGDWHQVGNLADTEHPYGASAQPYEIWFQGYRPFDVTEIEQVYDRHDRTTYDSSVVKKAGETFFGSMSFKLEPGAAFIMPHTARLESADNNALITEIHPMNERGDNISAHVSELEVVRANFYNVSEALSGLANNNNTVTAETQQQLLSILTHKYGGPAFQSQLQSNYSAITQVCSVFQDTSYSSEYSRYDSKGMSPDSFGELQFIFDQLRTSQWTDEQAVAATFMIYQMWQLEQEYYIYQKGTANYEPIKNYWTQHADSNAFQKFGDVALDVFNTVADFFTGDKNPYLNEDAMIFDFSRYLGTVTQTYATPLTMFGKIDDNIYDDIDRVAEIAVVAKDKSRAKDYSLRLTDLTVDYILLSDIYNHIIFNTPVRSMNSPYAAKAINSYKALQSAEWCSSIRAIVTQSTGHPVISEAYEVFKNQLLNGSNLNLNLQRASEYEGVQEQELYTRTAKYHVEKAFMEYVAHMASRDTYKIGKNGENIIQLKTFEASKKSLAYVYPYYVSGYMLIETLNDALNKMSDYNTTGVMLDFSTGYYARYSDFEYISGLDETKRFIGQAVDGTGNQYLSVIRAKPDNTPVRLGVYNANTMTDGGYKNHIMSAILNSDTPYLEDGYVNIYSIIYGGVKVSELEKYRGAVTNDRTAWNTMYDALPSNEKSLQNEYGINVPTILDSVTEEGGENE